MMKSKIHRATVTDANLNYVGSITVDTRLLELADIREHFAQLQVAMFKWPERIEHLPEIPRTQVGKTDKKLLQADIAAKIATERAALQSRS